MANIASDAILTRIREVIDDAAGSLRTISSSRFSEQYYPEMDDDTQGKLAMVVPRYDVRITGMRRHPATPPVNGSVALYEIDVSVTVAREMNKLHELDDATRDDVLALGVEDGDVLSQALMYPGNLTSTSGGTATGLVSGLLTYQSSSNEVVIGDGSTTSLVKSTHVFTGVAQAAPATS